jgi:DNA-binding GntR family transcriptional regulator
LLYRPARKTLSEIAYESLRESIIYMRLQPGQMVYETELSESLGMSRTPIREAFRMLLSEELIEVLPQRGGRITLISERKVEEVRSVRESLETSAIREATRTWNSQQPGKPELEKQIRNLLEQQKDAADAKDMIRFLEADEAFHRLLLSAAGNQTLITIVASMRGHLNRLRYLCLSEMNSGNELVSEHEALFAAVIANDEKQAVRLIRRHLTKLHYDLPVVKAKYKHFFEV